MTWSEAKAKAAEIMKTLRSQFSPPEIRLILRALSRLTHKDKPAHEDKTKIPPGEMES
jgi:hypothetical protein